MAELSTLARPYAKAAFDAAQAGKNLSGWSAMLRSLATVLSLPAVQALAENASLSSAEKVRRLADLCREDIAEGGENLLQMMAENNRLTLMPAVFEQFETLRLAAEETADVTISSAFALTDEQITLLRDKLTARLGHKVSISTEVDQSLKAGAIIRYGDTVIDGSARGRLVKLAEAMNS
ncbi:F0F1 ATP synthase subunit delta [Natronospirillum operosum]|uniref:ATP synthase subunit delta n=1 Tax=Natronospirillum operosum TaxID=2759953 RepID=A0A4Z0W8M9_9GAMM|nr:F0F1 ATP synthase subunit delta [Natronospirillum operosum]TGG91468.1 F0F1 ATP synthase subunit delta [Natronospirillum operosum]